MSDNTHPASSLVDKEVTITSGSHTDEEGIITHVNLTQSDPLTIVRPDGTHLGYFNGKEVELKSEA